ncbi:MAG TPA: peptidoglycan-binding protein [Acidimicrobiia bacterium]|nr:peptidoglycan-binding protein [Acidimicrobiia bacterium]
MSHDETAKEEPAPTGTPRRGFLVRAALVASVAAIVLALAFGEYLATRDGDKTPTTELAAATSPSTGAATTATTEATTTTTIPPTTTTTIPPLVQQAPLMLPPPPGGAAKSGNSGNEIWAYEARMQQLHFDPGPVDGKFDGKTKYAVEAVQKQYNLPRTGVVDQATVDALTNFQYTPLVPAGEKDRVEIDLDKQVLTVYRDWQVVLVTTTSTGSGKRFCGGSDGCQYAVTPPGKYAFTWHHNGWRDGDLGRLYNPWYFNGGIAVHGYSSVPTTPASHGCSRIPMHIAEYFSNLVYKDMTVYVLGTEAPRTGSGGGGGSSPATTAPTTVAPVPDPNATTVPPAPDPNATTVPPVTEAPTTVAPAVDPNTTTVPIAPGPSTPAPPVPPAPPAP